MPFIIRRYTKGVLLMLKMVYKRVIEGLDFGASTGIKVFKVPPPGGSA